MHKIRRTPAPDLIRGLPRRLPEAAAHEVPDQVRDGVERN